MKNKNGILGLDEAIKILLALIGMVLLGLFITGSIKIFTESTALGQAKESLEKISFEIEKIQNSDGTGEFFLESPKDWGVFTWEGDKKPIQCEGDYCVCICEYEIDYLLPDAYSDKCNEEKKGICREVPIQIITQHTPIKINPLALLKIYKDGDRIVIKEN